MSTTLPEPFVWYQLPSQTFCAVRNLQNVPDRTEIKKGISLAEGFPADAYFEMDPRYKKQGALADNIYNADRMPLVSPKLKAAIEALEPLMVEFLPVEIRDHKGKPVEEQFHIMSALAVVDCLDRKKSQVSWNIIDTELISDVTKLVIRPEAMDPALPFFRMKHLLQWTMIRADVAAKLKEQGFTGFEPRSLEKFTV